MGRVARIVILALAVVLAGLVAPPAWAAPPLPGSMAAIGDSITRAYDVCCSLSVSGVARQRDLSVSGVARQRDLWFFAGGWAWWTKLGSRWSGRSVARKTSLTSARATTG